MGPITWYSTIKAYHYWQLLGTFEKLFLIIGYLLGKELKPHVSRPADSAYEDSSIW